MAIKNFGAVSGTSIPSQTGNSGKILTTNGTTVSWTNNTIELIAHQTGVGGTAFTFSGIPQTYKHLKLITRFTVDSASTMRVQLNNSSISYTGGMHYYSTTTAVGGQATNNATDLNFAYVSSGSWATCTEINFFDYASGNRKAISAFSGGTNSLGYSSFGAATQDQTAINAITINTSGGVTYANYTATLYGWN